MMRRWKPDICSSLFLVYRYSHFYSLGYKEITWEPGESIEVLLAYCFFNLQLVSKIKIMDKSQSNELKNGTS